ncbi:MAG: 2-nitropropane dioxygenase, partial [Desulfuromusa sp.]|nr:2-nitropropane dioxygenase [Desulfuromusa sp.]
MNIVPKKKSDPFGLFYPVIPHNGVANDNVSQLRHIGQPLFLSGTGNEIELCAGDIASAEISQNDGKSFSGMVLPCRLENLGDPEFCQDHGIRYPYLGGSMAKGISSVKMAQEFGRAGMLGFFGAAGQSLADVEVAIASLKQSSFPFGFNLIHSPTEPELEKALVELYLHHEIRLIEASAFLSLTLPIIRYRTQGIYRNNEGEVITPNRVIAKISREEVAARFFAPPPEKYLRQLVESGDLTVAQAEMAAAIPVAQDATVEADSG